MTRRATHWVFDGCHHARAFAGRAVVFVPNAERGAFEAKWDAHAEALFAAYTARWTDAQRDAYRARLWPVPPPVVPSVLFQREDHGEERAVVDYDRDDDKGAF